MSNLPALTVGIASEYSWFHGYARWGYHIRAIKGQLREGYQTWLAALGSGSEGLEPSEALRLPDFSSDTASAFNSERRAGLANLSHALLRDVREPVERIFGYEDSEWNWDRILFWRRTLLHRAATFYGTSSTQYMAVHAHAHGNPARGRRVAADDLDLPPLDILPRWKHIQARMSLAEKPYEEQTVWRSIFHSSGIQISKVVIDDPV